MPLSLRFHRTGLALIGDFLCFLAFVLSGNMPDGCAAAQACGNWRLTPRSLQGLNFMRICVFGAGAVGSHIAVRLALAGHDVSCVMRGPHLEAVKNNGLAVRVGDAAFKAKVKASDDPAALGPQ